MTRKKMKIFWMKHYAFSAAGLLFVLVWHDVPFHFNQQSAQVTSQT